MLLTDSDEIRDSARHYKRELLLRMFGAQASAASPGGEVSFATAVPASSGILGVGYGAKLAAGAPVEDLAIRVYVRAKLLAAEVPEAERVPPQVEGKPTDIVAVGDLTALGRPVPSGVSVGHVNITAGTLGCLVRKLDGSEDVFILSNNHVLADANNAARLDDILEPGPLDGGAANPPIAELTEYEPLDFSGAPNFIDAAIARVHNPADITTDIRKIGSVVAPSMPGMLYQSVRKHGRTTRHTVGVIVDVSADVRVRYGKQIAYFENQLAITGAGGQFSDGGDSGSLILDAVSRRAVALLFAGGASTTFGNPIDDVLSHFGVAIL